MDDGGSQERGEPSSTVQVAVRVRPLNERERTEGHRTCVSFDEPTKQVVLTAVDKNTLLQLRGAAAKGYAFDRRYAQQATSDDIYDDCIASLVEGCFKGYNATVLAYGQTGSGKTHTMSGGVGIHGKAEEGVTPRVIRHIFSIVEQIQRKAKPGEKIELVASALELYNEDLHDLSLRSGREDARGGVGSWDSGRPNASSGLKLQERPVGKDGRVVPEVVGLKEVRCQTAEDMGRFYAECMENRSVSSTKLNDASSRSHAIFTISISRTMVDVLNELGTDLKAKVRTTEFTSKLHLVDLAGSERVKRSGVTGKELKEATHINSGLLALGNVIVALSTEAESKKKGHIPYRDSKLTRLLQDSLGGNSLTVLISCISPSEMDFEETNNTLKYANRACSIKNTPLPMKYTALEEDLLPSVPQAGGMGLVQLQSLLEDHERMKEMRERKEKERKEKEAKRLADLAALRDEQAKKPGYQRLRASAYDELRRQLASKGATNIPQGQVIADDALMSFGNRHRLTSSVEGLPHTPSGPGARPASARQSHARASSAKKPHGVRASSGKAPAGTSFADWLASQSAGGDEGDGGSQGGPGPESQAGEYEEEQEPLDFIVEDDQAGGAPGGGPDGQSGSAGGSSFIVDDAPEAGSSAAPSGKSKFRRGPARAAAGDVAGLSEAVSSASLAHASETGASSMDVQVGGSGVATPGPGIEGASRTGADGEEEAAGAAAADEEELPYDPIDDEAMPKLLARFKVNTTDVLSVFKAVSKEDFQDVVGLLPANTPLPASDKMTYLLARLEVHGAASDLQGRLSKVAVGESTMNEAVGPAVGCLMATFGTNMISSCIFEFPDPPDIAHFDVEERIELWGLQIPHNSVRPPLQEGEQQDEQPAASSTITWTSVDRLNMSIGLLYALCNHAKDAGVRCGFCVPRPQLLKRWLQAGVLMRQITGQLQLIYPPSAHDYEYYKASTVAWFMIQEVQEALRKVLGIMDVGAGGAA